MGGKRSTAQDGARAQPFRFAVQVGTWESATAWCDQVRWAEDAGFDVVSVPDHVGDQLAPLPALAAAAMVTTRVRLGTFVLAGGFRNPALLANDVATVDVLSGGRVELGLGCGWDAAEHRRIGIPFPRPPTRMADLEATVDLLRRTWRGEEVTGDVGPVHIEGFRAFPPPATPGGPPLVVGAGGPRMLALAARLADVVAIVPPTGGLMSWRSFGGSLHRDAARRQVAAVRAESARPALNLRILRVAVDGGGATTAGATTVSDLAAHEDLTTDELAASPFAAVGSVAAICDHLRGVREELGVAYFTVSQRHAPTLAPIVHDLAGT